MSWFYCSEKNKAKPNYTDLVPLYTVMILFSLFFDYYVNYFVSH